jgi:NAD(P)-dependent dehydrogenase (short-subunit alcohol dehydrogenase family)
VEEGGPVAGFEEFKGRVAVITGAASGMGEAMAVRAAEEGMRVVLVDVEGPALLAATERLRDAGRAAVSMECDVSDRDAVADLAAKVEAEVGDTWLLVNNAGVSTIGPMTTLTHEQWEFVLGVNLWGVIHGLSAFLPKMVERNAGYVVNTSSMAGLLTFANSAPYIASKHAVVGLTEVLYRELEAMGSNVGVSVLCPGAVVTNIMTAERNWPARLGPAPRTRPPEYPDYPDRKQPKEVAGQVFEAIARRQFWILTHPSQYAKAIRARAEGVAAARNPGSASVDPVVTLMRQRQGRG